MALKLKKGTETGVNVFDLIKIEPETQVCDDIKVVCPKCHLIFNISEATVIPDQSRPTPQQLVVKCKRCSKTFYVVDHKYE